MNKDESILMSYTTPLAIKELLCDDKYVKSAIIIAEYIDGTGSVIKINGFEHESKMDFAKIRLNQTENAVDDKGAPIILDKDNHHILVDFRTMKSEG